MVYRKIVYTFANMKHKQLNIRLPVDTDVPKLKAKLKSVAKRKKTTPNAMIVKYILNIK